MKLKRGDLSTDMEGNLTAKVGKNRWSVNTQTNMHYPPLEGNFCDKHGTAVKTAIIQDYNTHMGYVGKSDCMTNPYSISRRTSKWTNEIFLHLLDVTILNSCIILTSCASNYCINISHWHWWGTKYKRQEGCLDLRPQDIEDKPPSTSKLKRLDSRHNRRWLMQCKRIWCSVCSSKNKETRKNTSAE
jgi:hypothetical protein